MMKQNGYYILEGAEITDFSEIGVQTNLGSRIYMSGGWIHGNGAGVSVRKQSV